MLTNEVIKGIAWWQSLYSDSRSVSTAVTSVHILSLLLGGGFAIAADRTTLRVAKWPETERARHLDELNAVHRPVLIALTVLFVSGVLLTFADLKTFVASPIFWVKIGLVTLLLLNGLVLARTEARLRRDGPHDSAWRRMQLVSISSLTLWLLTAVAGTLLVGLA